jgi:4-hydroxy-tetrahydrodipicolinate synthase
MQPPAGVYNILATPFDPDGAPDPAGLRRLTEAVIAAGVDGITILGVAGEAQKLSAGERDQLTHAVLETVAGRVPVFVGASQEATVTCAVNPTCVSSFPGREGAQRLSR